MSRVNFAVSVLKAHDMGVLTVHSSMTATRTVATEANAEAVIDRMTDLATPHTLLGVVSAFFGDSIANRGTDPLDSCSRERGGKVKGGVDATLETS